MMDVTILGFCCTGQSSKMRFAVKPGNQTFCLGKNWGRSWWQVTGKGNASTDGAATRAT
jgi:hypothetical protein